MTRVTCHSHWPFFLLHPSKLRKKKDIFLNPGIVLLSTLSGFQLIYIYFFLFFLPVFHTWYTEETTTIEDFFLYEV